jgi:hypothetical protein
MQWRMKVNSGKDIALLRKDETKMKRHGDDNITLDASEKSYLMEKYGT